MIKPHSIVSPTAILCARARADITRMPYAKQMYAQLRNEPCAISYAYNPFMIAGKIFPRWIAKASSLEARYYSTNEGIARLGNPDVLELGAGVSPRGLEMAHGKRVYVETDLPEIIKKKKEVANAIRPIGENHHFVPVNVVTDDLCELSTYFNKKPVAVIHEGLLMYLTLDELTKARENIANFLQEISPRGAWITPDFSYTASPTRDSSIVGVAKWLLRRTTRPGHKFKSELEAKKFLYSGGLDVQVLDNSHLADSLGCVDILQLNRDKVREHLKNCRAWCITLRK